MGNFVVLRSVAPDGREVRVVLAHLRQGSVRMRTGGRVRAGEALGEVGNSGNTTEPHLHLGVTVSGVPGEPISGEGIPFPRRGSRYAEGRFGGSPFLPSRDAGEKEGVRREGATMFGKAAAPVSPFSASPR